MKKLQLATADFVKAAHALTNEAIHGIIQVGICEGITEMDPFIGNHTPVFFTYTFYGNLYSAQMYANKLFDTHGNAVTVPSFLEMARQRKSKFRHADDKRVLEGIAEAEGTIANLTPTINTLRARRNDFLAHLSPRMAFVPQELRKETGITLAQLREVLQEGGKIVNQFLQMWNMSVDSLFMLHSDDYKEIFSLLSKQLCSEIKAHEAKFEPTQRLPRPRDCR